MTMEVPVYDDTKSWICYESENGNLVSVHRRCPICSKYIKIGELLFDRDDGVMLKNWTCKTHGDIQPFFEFID